MQIENSFSVAAPADRVYDYLLDINRVVACVPGAELSELIDADHFKGRVKIKVGPVTVSYNGAAHITSRDPVTRTASLQAEGKETSGSGSARATTTMSVEAAGSSATVKLVTDFTVVGRVAQFGRGIMEDVSRRLVGQMADCIRTRLEAGEAAAASPDADSASATGEGSSPSLQGNPSPLDDPAPVVAVDALALGGAIARDRLRGLSRRRGLLALLGGFVALLLVRLRRRRRHRG